jgi:prophage regulatory protein
MIQTILRRHDVERVTGLTRSTIYENVAKGQFPKPIKLSSKSVGWLESEIADWQKARIAARDQVEASLARESRQRPLRQ